MADLQTALATALKEWEPETSTQESKQMETKQKNVFKPTNNVTRETFNFIKTHYGCTSTQVKDAMVAKGYKESSVHSLITQMVRNKLVMRDNQGSLATIVPEYVPIKSNRPVAKKVKAKPKLTKTKEGFVDKITKPVETAPKVGTTLSTPETKPEPKHLTAQYIMDNINLYEAKALFKILRMVFEENF